MRAWHVGKKLGSGGGQSEWVISEGRSCEGHGRGIGVAARMGRRRRSLDMRATYTIKNFSGIAF